MACNAKLFDPRVLISNDNPLILASASPRRRDLLAALGIPLCVAPTDIDETVRPEEDPSTYVERIVNTKMAAALTNLRGASAATGAVVLVADTIVVLEQEILGKPKDVEHALTLLKRLAGRPHRVLTRYALASPDLASTASYTRTVATEVTMASVSEVSLERYAQTGEGLDKAGAYAAQGIGAFLVQRLVGSYTNVVGLPVSEVVADLVLGGWLKDFP